MVLLRFFRRFGKCLAVDGRSSLSSRLRRTLSPRFRVPAGMYSHRSSDHCMPDPDSSRSAPDLDLDLDLSSFRRLPCTLDLHRSSNHRVPDPDSSRSTPVRSRFRLPPCQPGGSCGIAKYKGHQLLSPRLPFCFNQVRFFSYHKDGEVTYAQINTSSVLDFLYKHRLARLPYSTYLPVYTLHMYKQSFKRDKKVDLRIRYEDKERLLNYLREHGISLEDLRRLWPDLLHISYKEEHKDLHMWILQYMKHAYPYRLTELYFFERAIKLFQIALPWLKLPETDDTSCEGLWYDALELMDHFKFYGVLDVFQVVYKFSDEYGNPVYKEYLVLLEVGMLHNPDGSPAAGNCLYVGHLCGVRRADLEGKKILVPGPYPFACPT